MEIVEENGERWLVTEKYKTRVVDGRKEMEEMRRRAVDGIGYPTQEQ